MSHNIVENSAHGLSGILAVEGGDARVERNANHAGKTLALVESSLPYEITNELETLGAYDFGGKRCDSMTAHPKICPRTGELHFIGYGSLTSPYVTYHRANASGELIINRGIDVPTAELR